MRFVCILFVLKSSGPDLDFRVLGGHNQTRGQGGCLGPLWVQGKALVGGSGGKAPDGKPFSILYNGLDGSPLHYFDKKACQLSIIKIEKTPENFDLGLWQSSGRGFKGKAFHGK